jgi:hypothetical protein
VQRAEAVVLPRSPAGERQIHALQKIRDLFEASVFDLAIPLPGGPVMEKDRRLPGRRVRIPGRHLPPRRSRGLGGRQHLDGSIRPGILTAFRCSFQFVDRSFQGFHILFLRGELIEERARGLAGRKEERGAGPQARREVVLWLDSQEERRPPRAEPVGSRTLEARLSGSRQKGGRGLEG